MANIKVKITNVVENRLGMSLRHLTENRTQAVINSLSGVADGIGKSVAY